MMLAQSSNSEIFQLLEQIDPDFLGAIGMVTTILVFVLALVSVLTVFKTIQKVYLAKIQNQMVNELLAKGYSVDEIQQLVYNNRRNVLSRFFDNRRQSYVERHPTAPIKRETV